MKEPSLLESPDCSLESASSGARTLGASGAPKVPPTVALHTLGCKLNYAETSAIAESFLQRGYRVVSFGESADVLLLNTCSVTQNAEKECRQLIRRSLRQNPQTFVAVTGCYAQLRPEEIASIDGVDVVLGASEKFSFFSHVDPRRKLGTSRVLVSDIGAARDFQSAVTTSADARSRAFLKVQDGCDYSCSFCTIPEARGASRSPEVQSVLTQAVALCSGGFHELILSGVNVGDFGRTMGSSFLDLLQAMEESADVTARLRISSIEPNLLRDEIIQFAASSRKICPHFHIPLQSGSPRILRLMQRRYNVDLYRSRIERIRELLPHAAIGADVIVGFPGEGDDEFGETYAFLRELDITYLHVFTYSERPGTKAAAMAGVVPAVVRRERNHRLRILSEKKRRAFYSRLTGSRATVLLDTANGPEGERYGYTEHYSRVRLTEHVPQTAELVEVELAEALGDVLLAAPKQVLAHRREQLLPIL